MRLRSVWSQRSILARVGDALLRAERRQAIGRELDSAPVLDGDEALQWPFRAVDAVEQQHEAEPLAFQISSFEHRRDVRPYLAGADDREYLAVLADREMRGKIRRGEIDGIPADHPSALRQALELIGIRSDGPSLRQRRHHQDAARLFQLGLSAAR